MTGLLQNKTAIVYGAAGPVGAPVAGAFVRDGARVVLTGRAPGGGREAIPGLGGSHVAWSALAGLSRLTGGAVID